MYSVWLGSDAYQTTNPMFEFLSVQTLEFDSPHCTNMEEEPVTHSVWSERYGGNAHTSTESQMSTLRAPSTEWL